MKTQFFWHIHHDRLFEVLTEPIENRIDFINRRKPVGERALRLRLLKPVKGILPTAVTQARATYEKAWAAVDTAGPAVAKAGAAYDKAVEDHLPEIEALHKLECPEALHKLECPGCPFAKNTIFTRKNEKGEWY